MNLIAHKFTLCVSLQLPKKDIQFKPAQTWSGLNRCSSSDPAVCYLCVMQCQVRTYVWLLLGFPLLALGHCLACFLAWLLVFAIPVAKMNARALRTILLMPPEEVNIQKLDKVSFHTAAFILLKYPVSSLFSPEGADHCLSSRSKIVRPKFCCAATMLSTWTTTSTQWMASMFLLSVSFKKKKKKDLWWCLLCFRCMSVNISIINTVNEYSNFPFPHKCPLLWLAL